MVVTKNKNWKITRVDKDVERWKNLYVIGGNVKGSGYY
jgi:hypothetical protein